MNRYQIEEESPPPLLRVDPHLAKEQIERLQKLRASRNSEAVRDSIHRLKRAAAGTENLMPFLLEAVKAYATVGEISNALREVFGEYQPV
jgi:methylmalonyl-CoA mutase N-terminal domain/subunit